MNIENLKIHSNYVLVSISEDYENYQINGRDTGIKSALSIGTAGQRICVFGRVYRVPKSNNFLLDDIQSVRRRLGDSEEAQTQIDKLKTHSVSFDVPMELAIGDKIMFFYKNQIDCYKEGRVIRAEVQMPDGGIVNKEMMLMKYDTLNAIVKGEDELYPLNGMVFIEKVELTSDLKTAAGIHKLEMEHMGQKPKHAMSLGRVIEAGARCKGYLDFPGVADVPNDKYPLKKGDYVYYDGRMSRTLQFNTHQTLKTARTIIFRKDIYGVVTDPSVFDIAK